VAILQNQKINKMTKIRKSFFTWTLIFSSVMTFAQNAELPKFENDTLYTSSGFKIYVGQSLTLGTGSTPDGDFKFIRQNSTGFGTMMATTDNNAYNKSQLSLPRSMAGHKCEVKKIATRGNKRIGFKYEPLVTFGIGKYEIDADNAINSGELSVPDEFKPKAKATVIEVKQQVSIADELLKLKKLKDDGILSQEEYDSQKKKLLEK
jgi:hypothetical protein